MTQINIMIYSTVFCSLYQLIYKIISFYSSAESSQIIPKTKSEYWLQYLYLFSHLSITFSTYFAFYFVVRKQFVDKKVLISTETKRENVICLEEDIRKTERSQELTENEKGYGIFEYLTEKADANSNNEKNAVNDDLDSFTCSNRQSLSNYSSESL